MSSMADQRQGAILDAKTEIRRCLELLVDTKELSEAEYEQIQDIIRHKRAAPRAPSHQSNQYVQATYDWPGEQKGDLDIQKGDVIEILQKKSPEWYEGRLNGRVGMFPTNYVRSYDPSENHHHHHQSRDRAATPPPPASSPYPAAPPPQQLAPPPQYAAPPPQQYYAPPPVVQQAPFPPPSTGYYQQQQPQTIVVHENTGSSGWGSGIGSKLGNAALFGAGSAFGADIVNDIF